MDIPDEARIHLREAMALHARNDIAGAITEARKAVHLSPGYADAHSYLGSTLIQKLGHHEEGLLELELAAKAAPKDAAIYYTLGWCNEFVAHRLSRKPRPGLNPEELYAKAEQYLRRCLELNPEGKLRDDARDLLSSIIREDVT